MDDDDVVWKSKKWIYEDTLSTAQCLILCQIIEIWFGQFLLNVFSTQNMEYIETLLKFYQHRSGYIFLFQEEKQGFASYASLFKFDKTSSKHLSKAKQNRFQKKNLQFLNWV